MLITDLVTAYSMAYAFTLKKNNLFLFNRRNFD